jgi:protocatechuate 3,4-dioxygenase beta subunit
MKSMKKLALIALAVTTGTGAAAAASATPGEVTGRIQHLNPRAHHITVKSQTYRYNPRLAGMSLRRGEEVRILYRVSHGQRVAVKIMPAA